MASAVIIFKNLLAFLLCGCIVWNMPTFLEQHSIYETMIHPHHLFYLHFPVLGTTSDRVEIEHYDPYNNTWALSCPALKYVTNFTATACHGKLYVIGSCAVKYNALTMQCYNPVIGKNA